MAGGKFGGGYGTVSAPFLVEDAADLKAIGSYMNRHFKQVRDIDLSNIAFWEAIGITFVNSERGTTYDRFTGTYDGNGYVIRNMRFDTTEPYSGTFIVRPIIGSLFASAENATLINITIEDSNADARRQSYWVGFLLHRANSGTVISNCKVSKCEATTLTAGVGGLVYIVYAGVTIEHCEVDRLTINYETLSTFIGAVGELQTIGGLVALVAQRGPSYLKNNIYSCSVTNLNIIKGSTYGNYHSLGTAVGGLVGDIGWGGSEGTASLIFDCYVRGTISAYLSDRKISDSYADETHSIGGLVGHPFNGGLNNCYAAVEMDIITNIPSNLISVGPLYGNSDYDAPGNSYFDKQLLTLYGNTLGNSCTTAQMKRKSTFVDWDFDSVWTIREGLDYPTLRKREHSYSSCKALDLPLRFSKMR